MRTAPGLMDIISAISVALKPSAESSRSRRCLAGSRWRARTSRSLVSGGQGAAAGIRYRRMIIWGTGDLLASPDTVTTVDDGSLWSRTLKVARIISKRDVFVFICAALTALQLPLAAFLAIGGGTYPTFLGVLVNDRRVAKMTPPGR